MTDVFDVGSVERDDDAEFKRLTETYGACVKEKLFPGAGQRLPTRDERYAPRPADTIANPGPSPTAPVVVPSDVPGEIISGAVPTPAPAPPLPSPLTEATQTAELPPAVIAAATQTAAVPPTPRRPTPVAAPS